MTLRPRIDSWRTCLARFMKSDDNEMTQHTSRSKCRIVSSIDMADLARAILEWLPEGQFERVVLKPNWVKHQENTSFPIDALVTNGNLIDGVIEACLEKYSGVQEITIGDVPLQSCRWDLLIQQSGIDRLMEKYRRYQTPRIRFLDLRKERVDVRSGFIAKAASRGGFGDPKGYREVQLDDSSFLDPISGEKNQFRVSDYDPEETTSSHRRGFHRYLICGSALECDLFINLPKMKTHQKTGITGALKNLVGINGEKAYLVHYRQGNFKYGGDEFPPGTPWPVMMQTKVREAFQKKSKVSFQIARSGWLLLRKLYGIQTEGTPENLSRRFYTAAGSWYGNDSIWRMVYDLNKIIRYSPCQGGCLAETPQREYVAIMDGMTAGEGNGPLQTLPIHTNTILLANDPFLMDMVMAQLAGFDYRKIPLLSQVRHFADRQWGTFDPEAVVVKVGGIPVTGIPNIRVLHRFIPPPGWRGHIELLEEQNERQKVPAV